VWGRSIGAASDPAAAAAQLASFRATRVHVPAQIDWLLVDVNLAPQVALHEVGRLMPRLRAGLRGAVFTLKLNDWTFVAELPLLVDRIRQMGLPDVRMQHLPSNRKEICAVALLPRREL